MKVNQCPKVFLSSWVFREIELFLLHRSFTSERSVIAIELLTFSRYAKVRPTVLPGKQWLSGRLLHICALVDWLWLMRVVIRSDCSAATTTRRPAAGSNYGHLLRTRSAEDDRDNQPDPTRIRHISTAAETVLECVITSRCGLVFPWEPLWLTSKSIGW